MLRLLILLFLFISFDGLSESNKLVIELDIKENKIDLLLINESNEVAKIFSSFVFNDCELKHSFCIEYKNGPSPKKHFIEGGTASKLFNLWPSEIYGKRLSESLIERLFPKKWQNSFLEFRVKYFLPELPVVKSKWYRINYPNGNIEAVDEK